MGVIDCSAGPTAGQKVLVGWRAPPTQLVASTALRSQPPKQKVPVEWQVQQTTSWRMPGHASNRLALSSAVCLMYTRRRLYA